jgi:hypothetical protein
VDLAALGLVGLRGKIGPPGDRGPHGMVGPVQRDPALEGIQEQVHNVYRQLDIQLKRMAQMQQQIDEIAAGQERINAIVG